jgi:hypothetical protein
VPGGSLITQDIDRQTLQVAYLAQYPQRGREIVHLGLIGGGGAALVAAYYLLWSGDAALLGLLIVLGAIAVTVLWFERALLNFDGNDGVARELRRRDDHPGRGQRGPRHGAHPRRLATRRPAGWPSTGIICTGCACHRRSGTAPRRPR